LKSIEHINRNMKKQTKPMIALVCGAILFAVTGQTAQAALLSESGTSILADVNGTTAPPEALTVSWSVVENASFIYTYSYIVHNPSGDVLLPGSYAPGKPEEFDTFTLSFNSSAPGAVIPGTISGGTTSANLGNGIFWFLYPPVYAGSSSGALSYESDNAPSWGNAGATDDNPPSPWSSFPDGQKVPVAPDSTSTLALLAGMLLLLPVGSAMKKKAGLSS
jgi:hypothetical protein